MIRCKHLQDNERGSYIAKIPECEAIEACAKCGLALQKRFRSQKGVTVEMIMANIERSNPETEKPTLATGYELDRIAQLARCSLRTTSFDDTFVANSALAHEKATFNTKGRTLLALLIWRYRGQLPPFKDADIKYLLRWLVGKERASFLEKYNLQ